MLLDGINHVAIVTGDTDRLHKFYVDVFEATIGADIPAGGIFVWYEEHGDPAGPPLVAVHGGILTFQGSFRDVLPWLTEGRRVIGVELQGHGHTPDTGRTMSIERFADDGRRDRHNPPESSRIHLRRARATVDFSDACAPVAN